MKRPHEEIHGVLNGDSWKAHSMVKVTIVSN